MGSLRVSHEQLNIIVNLISGAGTERVNLDSDYLDQLFRVKQLSKSLKLPIDKLGRFFEIMTLETQETESPLNSLPDFTIGDFKQLEERAQWMNTAGIDISEYDFLVNDQEDRRVSFPFTEDSVVTMANDLLNQSGEYLANPLSLVSELITEAASQKIFARLNDDGFITNQGAVTNGFTEFNDLSLIARELNWFQLQKTESGDTPVTSFSGGYLSEEALLNAGIINNEGMVIAANPEAYNLIALKALYLQENPDQNETTVDSTKLTLINDLLTARKAAQDSIPIAVTDALKALRTNLDAAILNALADLLGAEADLLDVVIKYIPGKLTAEDLIAQLDDISEHQGFLGEADPVEQYLYNLSKTLFLLQQFDLTLTESDMILANPQALNLTQDSLLHPEFTDLDHLCQFVKLKKELESSDNELIVVLQEATDNDEVLSALTAWARNDIRNLAETLSLGSVYNTIPSL